MKLTPAFWKWFGKSKVIDTDGNPLVVYHGTTHDFTAFDLKKTTAENHYGKAFYFSSSQRDIEANYAAGDGPDLTSRIEKEAEKILETEFEEEIEEYKLSAKNIRDAVRKELHEKAMEIARKKIAGSAPKSMACFLSIQNPIYIKPKGGTRFETEYEYEDPDDPDSDIIGESGSGPEMTESIRDTLNDFDIDSDRVFSDLSKHGIDTLEDATAYELDQALRRAEYLAEAYDEDTDQNIASEVIRKIYARAGYDGIIQDAYAAFGPGKYRKGMDGVSPDTLHYVCWKPTQIKSAIGNDGSFDTNDPDIRSNPKRRR